MSNVQIPNLPAATGLSGSEQFEGVQSGTSVRISASQIATYISSAYPAPGIASVDGAAPIAVSTVGNAATVSLDLQGVTNAYMATMPARTVKANVTGASGAPTDATVSQVLDTFGTTKGMMLYRDTTSWVALTSGTAGQVLTAQGTTAAPIWSTLSISPGSIAPTGVTAGTYGSASTVPRYTVLASGQLSAASNVAIVIPSTSVTGLGTMATQNANTVAITGGNIDSTTIGASTPAAGSFTTLTSTSSTNLGTISSGVWNGTPIAVLYGGTGATTASGARTNLGAAASGANSDITSLSGLTTPLSTTQGGTSFGSYTTGDLLYASTSTGLARLNDVATGNSLISGGVGVAPSWGKIGLTTHVSGTLPVANGGSGATTLTGFLKGNGTGAFTAVATIPNSGLTNSSITVGSTSIALGATSTTLAGLTTVTLTQDPTAALEATTKQYVDGQISTVSNTTFHAASGYATTADLGTVTYSNGTGGVGATLTQSGSPSVLIIDGYTFTATDVTNATRVLVKNQSSGLQNGIYVVTNEGSGAANWQLTRSSDFNTVGTGPDRIQTGASSFVSGGAVNGSTSWVMNTTGTITVGSTALVWAQTSSSASVTVTSPLTKVGSVIGLGTVPTTFGGTGLTTLTQYAVMLGNGTGNVAFASPGTTGYPLLSTGASSNPAFGQLSLSSAVTGTLPVANGGTGTSTAFTAGSVIFAGASGTYSQNNSELFWNNSSNFLGIGTGTPDAPVTLTAPTQTSVTAGTLPAGTDLHIVGANSAITRITQDSFGTGNYPAYTGRSARGTAATPTATQSGDILSQYGGRGRGATDYSSSSVARIDLEAAENFTDTAQGSFISLHTTALGTVSQNERFRAGPAGQWGIGGANYGTSGQVFTSGGASAAPSWASISVSSVTGTLPVANGGTGLTTYTIGDLIYASGATALSKLADVATGNALISGGVGVAPSWGKIGLTTHVNGTLAVANGGTGATSLTGYVKGNGTSAMTASSTIPSGDITGLGTMAAQDANAVAITGGTINGTAIGGTTAAAGTFNALTVNGDAVISTSSVNAALRITQTGTGNAILVEDSANPDATPFVVNNAGQVLVGSTTSPFGSTTIGLFSNTVDAVPPYQDFFKNRAGAVVASGDVLGRQRFFGYDGAAYLEAARIDAVVDTTPGLNDMPGSLRFYTMTDGTTTLTERMRIDNAGQVGIGSSSLTAGRTLSVSKNITGATSSYGVFAFGAIQSDVTTQAVMFRTAPTVAAASFTLGSLIHFDANQGSIGAGATLTNQYGHVAGSTLIGAATNYGFFGNMAAGTTRTITNVARTSNVATITTSVAHGYLAGQSVTVAATTNTSLNGTFTITGVPTTSTFTYDQVAADIPSAADTGSTVVVGRWNFYANGTAPNYFGGATTVSTSSTDAALRVTQTGAGNALLIEDSTNPDATPFVVDATGNVIVGYTTTVSVAGGTRPLTVNGAGQILVRATNDTSGPILAMGKTRSTSLASNTIVQSGDQLGGIFFTGDDGTNINTSGASIVAVVDGTPGATDMPGRLVFSTTADGAGSPSPHMTISSSGRVGIGTTTPAVKLAISSTDAILVPVGTTVERPTGATGYLRFNSTTTSFEGYNGTAWGSIGGGATGGGTDQIFYQNGQTVTTNYTITAGQNAGTFGPITVNSGITVTVPVGSTWSIV
jgi:hypothetical protein